MTRMPSAERRRQLVDAAIRAMTRDGVAKTTTRSICAEAGVSLSVFHYCFDSKQALFAAVMESITEHSASRVVEAVKPLGSLRETFRTALQAYWDHVLTHPGEHMLTYELTQYALRHPGFEHLAQRQYEQYIETHSAVIEQLGRALDLEFRLPVATLARYLAVMIDGLTLNFLVLDDGVGAADVLDTIVDQVVALVDS